jgi:sporulation protein YlmC with PRC-barrel domain
VSQDNVQEFSLFTDQDQATMDERSFRASEVIGDYVRLTQARDYGYVSDLIFQPDGTLKSVVVAPDVGWESYYSAFPWHGYEYGFEPGADVYELPYAEEEVAEYAGAYENWDYDGLFEGHL